LKIDIKNLDFVIFDCDGVILDSNKIKTEAFKEVLKKYPSQLVEKLIKFHRYNGGISRKIKFQYFFDNIMKIKNNKNIIKDALLQFEKIIFRKLLKAKYIRGVLKFIYLLKKNNIKIFIVSGGLEQELQKIFKHRKKKGYFNEILGSPRTKENNVSQLIKKYSLNTKNGLFFGDSRIDYKVAKKFRINFLFISEKSEWSDFKKLKKLKISKNFEKLYV
tara:strand:+ start:1611 stop:2264 length:654 start_codon:yes stop_codon:yes gene_type:complete